jgi:twinkle protein
MLERFRKIYLWMDHDGPGQEGAKQFAQKIGINRCHIVHPLDGEPECKDANEALLKGVDLEAMIQQARVTEHKNISDFEAIRGDVIHEILHPDEYKGVPMPSLPLLTNLIKGYRRGELTILTGPTGRYVLTSFESAVERFGGTSHWFFLSFYQWQNNLSGATFVGLGGARRQCHVGEL